MSLYSDKTFENIQKEALQDINNKIDELPANQRVDASEGSLIYMAIAKMAVRLEEAYQDLDEMNDNMLVDTQDLEHLIDSGAECGIPIKEGTQAIVLVDLNCPCEIGDEFSAIDSDYKYLALELVSVIDNEDGTQTYRYKMEADDDGIDPGSYRGEVEPEDYLDGFEEGRVISLVTAGTEQEDEETYRERRLNSFTSKACAGNYDYYKDTIGAITGVGGVKVVRRQQNQSFIPCYIQASDYGVPSAELLSEIKEIMDPTGNEGEGMGLCPFGHVLQVNGVSGVEINVAASLVFDDGYNFSMLKTALEEAVGEYIISLAEDWEDSGSIIVRKAVVESKLLSVTGVIDIDNVTLNGGDENITTTAYQIPILGTLTEVSDG